MSNTIINWRLWSYHFQVIRFGLWIAEARMVRWPMTFRPNAYHNRRDRKERGDSALAFYEGRRYAVALALILSLLIWIAL